jgi:hypothetical protein
VKTLISLINGCLTSLKGRACSSRFFFQNSRLLPSFDACQVLQVAISDRANLFLPS